MRTYRTILIAALLAVVALAGCASEELADPTDDAGDGSDEGDHGAAGNGTVDVTPLNATLVADVVNGTAPMQVNFTLDATHPNATWELDFGDGNTTAGDGLPADASHTYRAGDFTASLTVEADGNSTTSEVDIAAAAPAPQEPEPEMPEKLSWEFGPSAGCAGDTGACISLAAGPDQPPVDGFWIELDERYWGLSFTGTAENQRTDSDCWFIKDDGETKNGDANNADGPCAGTVPAETKWIFLYSYAEPATAMTLEFIV